MPGTNVLVMPSLNRDETDNGPRYDQNRIPMPAMVKDRLSHAAKLGAIKLAQMIESPEFDELPIERKFHLIEMLMRRAYGAPSGSPKEALPPAPMGDNQLQLTSELRRLSKAAKFPEMKAVDPSTVHQNDNTPDKGE